MYKSQAISFFETDGKNNGVANLAEQLDVTRQCIYQWPAIVPRPWALEIEKLTDGKLKAPKRRRA